MEFLPVTTKQDQRNISSEFLFVEVISYLFCFVVVLTLFSLNYDIVQGMHYNYNISKVKAVLLLIRDSYMG